MDIIKKRFKTHYKGLILGSLIVILIWVISGFIVYYIFDEWSNRGTFGDMFGAVNALFSGLAFAGLIFTIIMQREEIKNNQAEIQVNRSELHKSVKAQQKTQRALQLQAENTKLTARLNAVSTVINYYNAQISNVNTPPELIEKARVKRRELIRKIDELIDDLEDSDVD